VVDAAFTDPMQWLEWLQVAGDCSALDLYQIAGPKWRCSDRPMSFTGIRSMVMKHAY
jgi:hypothetical protein